MQIGPNASAITGAFDKTSFNGINCLHRLILKEIQMPAAAKKTAPITPAKPVAKPAAKTVKVATPVPRAAPVATTKSLAQPVTWPKTKSAAPAKVAVKTKAGTKPKSAKLPKIPKIPKEKKAKLVRDSFTIPKSEYLVLDDLKSRANQLARPVKKSELLRAGIKLLATLPSAAFLLALNDVPLIKTGRPSKS
jgi:hypothetical protein